MDPVNDGELLRRHVEHGDQAAFAEVVHRHVNLVYSTAKRLAAGDAHLAEDVSQQVFTSMASQSRYLAGHPTLAGWLHATTRNIVCKAIRTENRRRAREQELVAMQNIPNQPEIQWEKLQPVLDEAISYLGGQERDALLLRYFEGMGYRDVGDRVGLNEEAARKRVDRALEKLRTYFARSGVSVSAGLLAETMGVNSVQAAPAGLAETLSASALAGATTSPGIIYLLLKPLFFMTTTTKIVLAAVVIVAAVASFNYAFRLSDASSTRDTTSATTASQPTPSSPAATAQVALPKQAPTPVLPQAIALVPPVVKAPAAPVVGGVPTSPGTGNSPANVDPRTMDAMAMMQPMKALYNDIYTSLMQTNDPDAALQKLQTLQPQIDELKIKVKGTQLESIVTPALGQLTAVRNALQHGDLDGAKKIIESLNQVGAKVQARVENTAGVSIDQAASAQTPASGTSQN